MVYIKRVLAIMMAGILFITPALAWGGSSSEGQYDAAVDLMRAGSYAEAAQAFADLGNYEDSNRLAMYCAAIAKGE